MVTQIEARGSHWSLGETHGQMAEEQIRLSLANYRRMFEEVAGIDWREARRTAETFKPAIEQASPELLEEMAGIADGARVDLLDILVLNARSEIVLTHAGRPVQSDGCSALYQRHPDDDSLWLAQNWDWIPDQREALVALTLHPDNKPAIHMITEAGIIGKIGMNALGVGVCLNALRSRICKPKLPVHVMLRRILESDGVEHALDMVDEIGTASPAHFLIADADGKAASVEVSPMGDTAMLPRKGALFHTNHLVSRHLPPDLEDFPNPDSFDRLERLRALSQDTAPSFDTLFERLSDEHGAPNSICRYVDPERPAAERMETLFTIVMNLKERSLRYSFGRPGPETPQHTFHFEAQ
ncbi:C45 family autoproteolytic acyltransferase/hydolase [Larsenimonas suaedae]|uniref:C45 family autoproteolytic acyltransferase/hydrolase n=1 Tax=Larsenimonas suaedae TaxID=1851019 RepID=A0ABU1GTC5_9GAMM|nr:C45 family peptidase [Larsenimonas suaedae]MCM2971709.1 C45 family peptidase [Larsenimonas suaedae]MDR5895261.1 C45 family autoproteolytic acyltransferase/hydrolase [Larsenimonas suaedae]